MICAIVLSVGCFQANAQQTVNVGLEVVKTLRKDKLKSETGSVVVSNDVVKDGKIVIAAGTPVVLDIQSEKHRGLGKPGTITVRPVSTTDVNGQVVSLNGAEKSDIGKNRHGAAVACGIVFGIITFPVGLLFLCIKGGNASIPAGTQMVATATLN
jgi:hypothetical protein